MAGVVELQDFAEGRRIGFIYLCALHLDEQHFLASGEVAVGCTEDEFSFAKIQVFYGGVAVDHSGEGVLGEHCASEAEE